MDADLDNNPGVAIIGAGPAGLTTAYFLQKKGIDLTVYESSDRIGGLGGAIEFNGRSLDIGPHVFLESSQPAAVEFWKATGGRDLQRLTLSRGMILRGRISRYPPTLAGLARSLGPVDFCRAAVDVMAAKLRTGKAVHNAGDFFSNYYGDYFRKIVFNPFCEKYMGIADSRVDIDFATSLTSFVKEAAKTDVQANKKRLRTLLYHRGGTKRMWSAVAATIGESRSIQLAKRMTRIITEGKRIKHVEFSDGSVVTPRYVVSTLPLAALLRAIDHCPPEILGELQHLNSRNTVLVYLSIKNTAFPYQYITVFDQSVDAGRITNFNSWTTDTTLYTTTTLCVEYWCGDTDVVWQLADEALEEKAVQELMKLGITEPGSVIDVRILRLQNTHPVLSTGYIASLARINNYLSGFENLLLAGRHATFKWDGQADNIIAELRYAEKIEEFLADI